MKSWCVTILLAFTKPVFSMETIRIVGKTVPCVSSSQCLIESGGVLFDLNCDEVKKRSIELKPFKNVDILLGREAIKKVWSLYPTEIGKKVEPHTSKPIFARNNKILLKGLTVASFEDPFYLIEVSGAVYKIQRNLLSPAQQKYFNTPGKFIESKIPKKAIQIAWTLNPSQPTLVEPNGRPSTSRLEWENDKILVKGRMMCSFENTSALIQTADKIVRLEIDKNDPFYSVCSRVGESVELKVDISKIKNVWETNLQNKEDLKLALYPNE